MTKNRPLLPAAIAFSALLAQPLLAEIVIDVDVTAIKSSGTTATIPNTGTTAGDFVAGGDLPIIETITGVQAVTLDGTNDYYVGPPPPASTTGFDPVRSVEVWTYNPAIVGEETIVAWGRRGGPEGSNFSFNFGNHGTFGAVGHWGAPDIGWIDAANTAGSPTANEWHHLVYTYDGVAGTTIVYADGQESNREENIFLDTHVDDDFGDPLPITIGAQNLANGGQEPALQGSLSIARLRVHDTVLTPAEIANTFTTESADFVAFVDSDNDTMDDRYEQRQFGDLDEIATGDPDNDGLDNAGEATAGTCATVADTDGDGTSDGDEINRTDPQTGDPAPTDPLSTDTDGDGLADNVETDDGTNNGAFDTGTDPTKADTDGDGFNDKLELDKGSDPNDSAAVPPTDPIIVLDATGLATGELPVWTNTGSLAGDFDSTDDGFNPFVETVDGVNGVFFDALDHYTGPPVPTGMTGNGARAITAWVHNPIVAGEETIFSWGRRGGPDKTNFSFNHGAHDTFGAVGAWGPDGDTGWDALQDAGDDRVGGDDQEVENAWTHVAVTFDGTTTSVYTDGRLTRADANGPFNTHALDDFGDPLPFRIGAQNVASGDVEPALRADMTIAQLSVWDQAIPLSVIEKDFDVDAINFGLRPINDTDNDGDLLGDGWELFWFQNLDQIATGNPDDDGLDHLGEFRNDTNPTVADTDGDGVNDGDEVNRTFEGNAAPTNPLNPDTDSDRLTDGQERDFGSNPLLADSDSDQFSDFLEFQEGSNPNDPNSIPNPEVVTPVNRYSFSETEGTTVIDSIGGADGTIIGTGFTQNGNSLSLSGGTSDNVNAAYVDLPNGLISVHTDLTVEGWFTLDASQNWSRVFDFGSSAAGEVLEHGGAGDGLDYILLSAQIGGNINQQRWEVRSFGVSTTQDTNVPTILGEQFHFALVFDEDGNAANDPLNPALISVYRDGVFLNSSGSDTVLADILDDNNWLGRSNWLADSNTAGTYDDFRIYDTALREAQVINSFIAGPDAFSVAPGSIKVTDIQFDETTREVVLTWTSRPGAKYSVDFSTDLATPFQNIEDGVDSGGDTTTKRISVGALTRIFLKVREE